MNECDWLDQVPAQLQALAEEIKQSLATHSAESKTLAETLNASKLPDEVFSAVPNLPKKTTLVSTLTKHASEVETQAADLLKALQLAEEHFASLKQLCQ